MKIAIVGWHEGVAGVTDSWLTDIGVEVSLFISITEDYLHVDKNAHTKFGNKKFSYPNNSSFKNRKLIFDPNWYLNASNYAVDSFLITESNPKVRSKQIGLAHQHGINLYSAIHPSVQLLNAVDYGDNCIIQAGSIIGYKTTVGNGVFINTGCIIDHHTVLEDCVTINPGCVIAGNVLIKKFATINTGAVIINKIVIGSDSVIGAGSVVIKDVGNYSTVVGVPAVKIKR